MSVNRSGYYKQLSRKDKLNRDEQNMEKLAKLLLEQHTDNPIIEFLNSWIKEELKIDFNLKSADNLPCLIKKYVEYFNNDRLSYKLHYKTPIQYKLEKGFI